MQGKDEAKNHEDDVELSIALYIIRIYSWYIYSSDQAVYILNLYICQVKFVRFEIRLYCTPKGSLLMAVSCCILKFCNAEAGYR